MFPAGRFYDWFTGELVEGPTTMQREIPFDRIALYAREAFADDVVAATDRSLRFTADDLIRWQRPTRPSRDRR